MSFITLFCIYSMIFFFIVLLKNMFSGGSNRKYKGMTEEEKEEYSKRISENSKRNFEEWEELKKQADLRTARMLEEERKKQEVAR
ncbi:MAG: hypothetical protein MRZ50_03650 [Prevotella sp.]|nr:hypothetical protein [Prevotella sp.]